MVVEASPGGDRGSGHHQRCHDDIDHTGQYGRVSRRLAARPLLALTGALAALALLVACGSGAGGGEDADGRSGGATTAEGGSGDAHVSTAAPGAACADLEPIQGFGEALVSIDGTERCLLLAQTEAQRARGLMEVTDLQGYPGMLFVFPADTEGGFWMRNTPTPLSIAFLDGTGDVVATTDMAPCDDVPDCPIYQPGVTYRYTVEVPQGDLDGVGLTDGAHLDVESEVDPE